MHGGLILYRAYRQQVVSVQSPLTLCGIHFLVDCIYWEVRIGLRSHNIYVFFSPIGNLVLALKRQNSNEHTVTRL
jgi:hypothetical protein